MLGGVGGAGAVHLLSSNTHDRSMEAVVTGFLVAPVAALAGAVLAFALGRRRP